MQNGVVDVAPTTEIMVEQGYEIERPSQIFVRVESDDDIPRTTGSGMVSSSWEGFSLFRGRFQVPSATGE